MQKVTFKQKIILVILSCILSLLICEGLLNAAGYIYLGLIDYRNKVTLGKKTGYRILFLGESTTAEGGWNSYPREVERILNKELPDLYVRAINKGVPAVSTTFVLSELEENLNKYKPHMIVAMMGINDITEDKGWLETNKLKKIIRNLNLFKLLKTIEAKLSEKKILVEKLLERGNFSQEMKNYVKAERMFGRALELASNKESSYIALGLCYDEQDKIKEARAMFEKALDFNPQNPEVYIFLGVCFKKEANFVQAEKMFRKYVAISSDPGEGYINLGWLYYEQGKLPEAEELFRKVISMYPNSEVGFLELARYYKQKKDYLKAEEMFNVALSIAPGNEFIYVETGWFYDMLGKFSEAQECFKAAIDINPSSDEPYIELERFYKKYKMDANALEIKKKIESSVGMKYYYTDVTINNYQKLKNICFKRKIKLVCVQYPRRSIKPLKEILSPVKGVIFVDNQKVFSDAINNGKFDDYFVDRFAGDFGHCTPKGNELLAKNVAETLLKEYFLKPSRYGKDRL